MRKTTITVQEDLKTRLNQLKYKFGYKTVDSVIRRLIEISSKLKTADEFYAKSKLNSGTSKSFLGGLKTTTSKAGANVQKEKK